MNREGSEPQVDKSGKIQECPPAQPRKRGRPRKVAKAPEESRPQMIVGIPLPKIKLTTRVETQPVLEARPTRVHKLTDSPGKRLSAKLKPKRIRKTKVLGSVCKKVGKDLGKNGKSRKKKSPQRVLSKAKKTSPKKGKGKRRVLKKQGKSLSPERAIEAPNRGDDAMEMPPGKRWKETTQVTFNIVDGPEADQLPLIPYEEREEIIGNLSKLPDAVARHLTTVLFLNKDSVSNGAGRGAIINLAFMKNATIYSIKKFIEDYLLAEAVARQPYEYLNCTRETEKEETEPAQRPITKPKALTCANTQKKRRNKQTSPADTTSRVPATKISRMTVKKKMAVYNEMVKQPQFMIVKIINMIKKCVPNAIVSCPVGSPEEYQLDFETLPSLVVRHVDTMIQRYKDRLLQAKKKRAEKKKAEMKSAAKNQSKISAEGQTGDTGTAMKENIPVAKGESEKSEKGKVESACSDHASNNNNANIQLLLSSEPEN